VTRGSGHAVDDSEYGLSGGLKPIRDRAIEVIKGETDFIPVDETLCLSLGVTLQIQGDVHYLDPIWIAFALIVVLHDSGPDVCRSSLAKGTPIGEPFEEDDFPLHVVETDRFVGSPVY